jgi:hypothetical protein
MLEAGKYSDLVIKCKGKVFNVHPNIVCLQSKPLAAMVDGKFLVGPSYLSLCECETDLLLGSNYGRDPSDRGRAGDRRVRY